MSLFLVGTIVQVVSSPPNFLIDLLRKASQLPMAKKGGLVLGGA